MLNAQSETVENGTIAPVKPAERDDREDGAYSQNKTLLVKQPPWWRQLFILHPLSTEPHSPRQLADPSLTPWKWFEGGYDHNSCYQIR